MTRVVTRSNIPPTKGDVDETTQVLDQGSRQEYPSYELTVLGGPDSGLRRSIDPQGLTVGSGAICQMKLTDPTVSRMHCEVRVVEGAARVIDLGSTNGVIVNGVRVKEAVLSPHSTIQLGETTLRVDAGDQLTFFELSRRTRFGNVIGASKEMRRLFTILEKASLSDATVLIQGETGVGKELVARAIHDNSERAEGPFVVVDCGAIAENLIESELFGHTRGAFSGAVSDRRGLFEEAHGGTLFLDEIGELPAALQPRLLRVLESREVRRIGSNQSRKIDVRIVAATNRSLAESINNGSFREDLYYRIAVVEAHLPPLRQRGEDVVLLAEHFYRRYAGEDQNLPDGLADTLKARAWPGNVRELRNFIERSVSLGFTEPAASGVTKSVQEMSPDVLAHIVPTHLPLKDARAAWTEQFELLYVTAILAKTDGNVTRAAELAGVNRRSLQRLIANLQLRARGEKSSDPPDVE
jgi:transcriptional regulator with PAS, ATPase and Fis domain